MWSAFWAVFWFLIEYWFITAWVLAVVGTWVVFGRKMALVVATAGVGHVLYTMGRKAGEDRYLRKANRDADKAIERARKVRADADKHNADPQRLRESDGWRRD